MLQVTEEEREKLLRDVDPDPTPLMDGKPPMSERLEEFWREEQEHSLVKLVPEDNLPLRLASKMFAIQQSLCPRERCGEGWQVKGGCSPDKCKDVSECWYQWFQHKPGPKMSLWGVRD